MISLLTTIVLTLVPCRPDVRAIVHGLLFDKPESPFSYQDIVDAVIFEKPDDVNGLAVIDIDDTLEYHVVMDRNGDIRNKTVSFIWVKPVGSVISQIVSTISELSGEEAIVDGPGRWRSLIIYKVSVSDKRLEILFQTGVPGWVGIMRRYAYGQKL